MLLEFNANVNLTDINEQTPLHISSTNGNVEVVTLLLENAASVDSIAFDKSTPLMETCAAGLFGVVKVLLDDGASVDSASNNRWTPLYIADDCGDLEIAKLLLDNAVSVCATIETGNTLLIIAAESGCLEMAKMLLFSACRDCHSRVAQSLLKKGASHDAVNNDGESALTAAAASGCFEAVDTLIQAGASPHVRAINGDTILIHAAKWDNIANVNQLFEAGQLNTQITSESRVSLLGGTLQTQREYNENVHKFQTLWSSVLERFLRMALDKKSVLHRAKSQDVWLQQELFHRHIDEILELLSVSSGDSVHKWTRCGATRDTEIGNLKGVINRLQSSKAAAAGTVKILRFDSDISMLSRKSENIGRSEIGTNKSGVVPQRPKWYVPTHELKYNRDTPIAVGAFADGDECNNLIGADEDAKIADFGLSCIPSSAEMKIDSKLMGAIQWKSPEYLRGDRLTAASDLMIDAAVRFRVQEGNLSSMSLECLAGAEHGLVEMVCAPNLSERIRISSVVEKLDEFAKLEATATKAAPSASLNDVAP